MTLTHTTQSVTDVTTYVFALYKLTMLLNPDFFGGEGGGWRGRFQRFPPLNELYYPSLTARWAEISLEYCYKTERKVFLKKLVVTLRRQLPTLRDLH